MALFAVRAILQNSQQWPWLKKLPTFHDFGWPGILDISWMYLRWSVSQAESGVSAYYSQIGCYAAVVCWVTQVEPDVPAMAWSAEWSHDLSCLSVRPVVRLSVHFVRPVRPSARPSCLAVHPIRPSCRSVCPVRPHPSVHASVLSVPSLRPIRTGSTFRLSRPSICLCPSRPSRRPSVYIAFKLPIHRLCSCYGTYVNRWLIESFSSDFFSEVCSFFSIAILTPNMRKKKCQWVQYQSFSSVRRLVLENCPKRKTIQKNGKKIQKNS